VPDGRCELESCSGSCSRVVSAESESSGAERQRALGRKLMGHDAYYGITGNVEALKRFQEEVSRTWRRWLDRRSNGARMNWDRFSRLLERGTRFHPRESSIPSTESQRDCKLRSRMREFLTYGSVGTQGGQLPWVTRRTSFWRSAGGVGENAIGRYKATSFMSKSALASKLPSNERLEQRRRVFSQ